MSAVQRSAFQGPSPKKTSANQLYKVLLSTLYTVGESQGKHHQWREGLCLSCRFLRMTHQTCNKTSDFYCSNGVPTWHLGAATTKKWESQGKHHQWHEGLCLSCWFLPYDPPENHFQLDDLKKNFSGSSWLKHVRAIITNSLNTNRSWSENSLKTKK